MRRFILAEWNGEDWVPHPTGLLASIRQVDGIVAELVQRHVRDSSKAGLPRKDAEQLADHLVRRRLRTVIVDWPEEGPK